MFHNLYNKFRRITTNQLYFPEIDGIRFLAIVLVILFHTHGYFAGKTNIKFADDAGSYHLLNSFLSNGDRGVALFFVLSGFILCLPFAHQYINHGKKVVLKKYYLRRVTRLEPPYFLAMTAILIIQLVAHVRPASVLLPSWLASLAYSHDLIYHRGPFLTVVAWSLEVEIQFYLLAPLLFRILKLPKFTRRGMLIVATMILIFLQRVYVPSFVNIYGFAQYFFAGIFLADLYVSDSASQFFNSKWIAPASLALLIVIIYFPITDQFLTPTSVYFVQLGFPALLVVFYYAILKNDVLKKIFSYKFVPIIGGMCYSIYLLHYTIISVLGRFTVQVHFTNYYIPNLVLQIILLGTPILIISSIFYLYIERPFMSNKWVDKFIKKDKHKETANMQSEQ
jgi:peptidoglycan/LPS O-acetylase OafA/YrhL